MKASAIRTPPVPASDGEQARLRAQAVAGDQQAHGRAVARYVGGRWQRDLDRQPLPLRAQDGARREVYGIIVLGVFSGALGGTTREG